MEKSRDAFRTISEVAEWLDVPTHVLRFWESRFSQIKPVKRAGGRRYYRPSDMTLIGGIKVLLHDEGMTIRGVQKVLREQGVKHVSGYSPPLDGDEPGSGDVIDITAAISDRSEAPAPPAPAARSTRDAAPAPSTEKPAAPEQPTATASAEPEQPDMFDAPKSPGAATPDEATPDEATTDAPSGTAPLTPAETVPDTDPADDDPAFAKGPGIAARLAARPPRGLASHRALLETARSRLQALLERID